MHFSHKTKYVRFEQFWVVVCFLFTVAPRVPLIPRSVCCVCAFGKGGSWRVMVRSLWASKSSWGSRVSCRPWAQRLRLPEVRCSLDFFLPLQSFCVSQSKCPFFSPFWPTLSTRKLVRSLIGLLSWGPPPATAQVGFLQSFPSYLGWKTVF